MAANATAPPAEQLGPEELVLDTARLQQLRAGVDAEVAGLLQAAARQTQTLQIRAQRLKALCWDSMQVCVRPEAGGSVHAVLCCVLHRHSVCCVCRCVRM